MILRALFAAAVLLLAGAGLRAEEPAGTERLFESAVPERVATGYQFTEGPAWGREGFLLFTDIPAGRIVKWVPDAACTVFREPSGNANGLAFDRQGRLLACEHGNRRVSRTDAAGTVTTLADRYGGKRLNSPNDLAIRSDGSVYFTDPPYGVQPKERELDFCGLYRIAPDGTLSLLAGDFERPNGVAFSPDEKTLYVDDTARRHVRAFTVRPDGGVAGSRILCEVPAEEKPSPDGLKVDREGNLYVTAGRAGLWVFRPTGQVLCRVALPEGATNCAFGGPDGRSLFVTAGKSLYRLRTAR